MPTNLIAFAAHDADVDIHYHRCFQVVVSITNRFNCTIEGKMHKEMNGFIVNQGVKHSCMASNSSVLALMIDAESVLGWNLKSALNDENFLDIEKVLTDEQIKNLQINEAYRFEKDQLNEKCDLLFNFIFPSHTNSMPLITDERVQKIIEYIALHIDEKIELDHIAQIAFLSPERARHLFVEHTGIPFSQYLLWKRIKHIMEDVLHGKKSISEAAVHYGFTDQPHFSRIFKRIFGTPAKPFLKNSRFIQLLSPSV